MNRAEHLSFTDEHVRKLAGLSLRQLRYWDDTGFFSPGVTVEGVRFYSFRDVVGLRVIALLRQKLPLQELRKIGKRLAELHATPWASIRFYLSGRHVYFDDPKTGKRMATNPTGQRVELIEMKPISTDVMRAASRLQRRTKSEHGVIGRDRRVVHNEYVIAGTRIPTSLIWRLHEAGSGTSEILAEYPTLTSKDVTAAIEFERDRQKATRKRRTG